MDEQEVQILNTWKEELERENESIKSKMDELEKEKLEVSIKYDVCFFVNEKNKNVEEISKMLEEYDNKRKELNKTFEEKLKNERRRKNINQLYINEIARRVR